MNVSNLRAQATLSNGTVATCTKCGQHTYVMPLHDERGGPLFCFMCAGAWHAEHAPRRRARRVLIKALKAYEAAGGSVFGDDFDELKLAASGFVFVREADNVGNDFSDLTTELLNATIALTHPDKHPVERKAEANRVTQELHALKPFVFPAPPPKEPEPPAKPDDGLFDYPSWEMNKASLSRYPCDDCADALPVDYCDACRAKYDKKQQEADQLFEKERQQRNKRQREYYQINKTVRQSVACATCGKTFRPKRSDAKYCSAACRQRAYVKRDGKASNARPLRSKDIERAIEAAFTTKPDNAFNTNDLCEHVYSGLQQVERKHRAAVIPIAKKVCERLGENWDWCKLDFNRGSLLVFWNRASLTSYVMMRIKQLRPDHSEAELKALISPGGFYHPCVVAGGHWWKGCQEDLVRFAQQKKSKGPDHEVEAPPSISTRGDSRPADPC